MYNSTDADGDEMDFQVYLAAGTYTIILWAYKGTDQAIVDIDIDAAEVASFDLYDAGAPGTSQRLTDAGNVVATSGLKTITYRVDGKNGASSNHFARWEGITFSRTA